MSYYPPVLQVKTAAAPRERITEYTSHDLQLNTKGGSSHAAIRHGQASSRRVALSQRDAPGKIRAFVLSQRPYDQQLAGERRRFRFGKHNLGPGLTREGPLLASQGTCLRSLDRKAFRWVGLAWAGRAREKARWTVSVAAACRA